MFCTYTSFDIPSVFHHEVVDHCVDSCLQILITIAFQSNIEMQISVSNVAIANSNNALLFSIIQKGALINYFAGFFNNFVVMMSWQADIVFETIPVRDACVGNLLS